MARQEAEESEETTNSDDLNSYSSGNEEAHLSANNEKETGFNQDSDDPKSPKTEEKPKRTISAKSDRLNIGFSFQNSSSLQLRKFQKGIGNFTIDQGKIISWNLMTGTTEHQLFNGRKRMNISMQMYFLS